MKTDARNTNSLWASVLVETLARAGVREAVISPGSRSTPLTIALAGHDRIHATPVLDERSAAFLALGQAKWSGRPVVLVCTSGTAGANYFPAVIEAQESGVPLIVITADRPPELRACASGQTIDQLKLFGSHVGFFHELATPELDRGRFRYLRQMVLHAVERSLRPQAGPVHLNAPFRDPLPPVSDGGAAESFAKGTEWNAFFAEVQPPVAATTLIVPPPFVREAHGVIVVGPNQPQDHGAFASAVGELARRLGWPVLADGLSPLRNHASAVPHLVTTYDAILRNAMAAERLAPEVVLCVGSWPTSKVLRGWLQGIDAPVWMMSERTDNRDALHGRARTLPTTPAALVQSLAPASESGAYQRMWARYEQAARRVLDARLDGAAEMVEPKVAWLLARYLPAATPLFISNSMPVRDVEYVWPAGDRGIRPFCNRGANGIDGTLSTAFGVAAAAAQPAVLLTGDLALLHDTNGFLLCHRVPAALTIVLINNRGGGIFEHLPVAQFEPPFEEFFATPQTVDIGKLCEAYGVEHTVVRTWDEFVPRISSLPARGVRVLEVQTDRKRDAALRKQWFAEIGAGLTQ